MTKLLIFSLSLLFAGLAYADQIAVHEAFEYDFPMLSACLPCIFTDSIEMAVPRFDPSLGHLREVDYSFTDNQTLFWGFNDVGEPAGIPFEVIFHGQVKAASGFLSTLPIDLSYTATTSGLTTGQNRDISEFPGISFVGLLTASGVTYSKSFVGTGFTSIGFQSSATIAATTGDPVFVGFKSPGSDSVTLDLTYKFSPVPEPSYEWIWAGAVGTLMVAKSGRTVRRLRRALFWLQLNWNRPFLR